MSKTKIQTGQPIISLLGKELYFSLPDDEASIKSREEMTAMVEASLFDMEKDPSNPVHYGCAGFHTWSLNDLQGSLAIFDKGTENCPDSHELYWLKTLLKTTMRDLPGAIADAECAVALIKDKPDHGFDMRIFMYPDPRRYYPSSVHYVIWYHLGMAYYLNGELEKAKDAYIKSGEFIYGNSSLISRSCWFYPVLRELGEHDQAEALMADIDDDIRVLADPSYKEQSLLFKGTLSIEDIQAKTDNEGNLNIAHEYAIAYWHYTHGDVDKAKVLFERVCARPEIGIYVMIAAEAKLKELLSTQ
ncbi:MAG TPA: hypothetical protein DCE52_11930 [Rhodobacteraceae bacterium]|nr:hypothetical protein [Paracoccaceae bacterium]